MLGQLASLMSGAGAGSLGALVVQLTADSTRLVRGMQQAEIAVESGAARMLRHTKLLAAGATTALVGVGIAAVRQAALFESSFAGVRKTVDATEEEFAMLASTLRNMAKETPASIHEINRVAEAAGQLGIKKQNLASFSKVMLQLGTATNMASEEAATALARLANISGMAQTDFDRLGATIVALGNSMATTESEIVTMALRLAGAGRQVGLTEHQVLALASSLSSVGMEAEAGGTGMSRIMVEMAKAVKSGSKELRIFAETAGMTSGQFVEAFEQNATRAILAFLRGLKNASAEGDNVFALFESMGLEGVRLTDVLSRASLASELFADALGTAETAWQQNTALTEEARKRYETFASQLAITKNLFVELFIEIGQNLLPVMKDMNKELQNFLKGINTVALSKDVQVLVKGLEYLVSILVTVTKRAMDALRLIAIAILQIAKVVLDGMTLMVSSFQSYLQELFSGLSSALGTVADLVERYATSVAGKLLAMSEPKMFENIVKAGAFAVDAKKKIDELGETVKVDIDFSDVQEMIQTLSTAQTDLWDDFVSSFMPAMPDLAVWVDELTNGWTSVGKAAQDAATKTEESSDRIVKAVQGAASGLPAGGLFAMMTGAMVPSMFEQEIETLQKMEEIGGPDMLLGKHGQPRMTGLGMDYATAQAFRLEEEKQKVQKALEELGEIETNGIEVLENQKTELMEQWMKKRQQLRMAEAQLALASTSQMFGDLATIAKTFAGEQSDIYKAMFAASKAFAVAESVVKIQQGVANAASLPFPGNLAAIASVVAATASIVSTITSTRLEFAGARAMGGPVSKDKAYLVGERGRSELFVPRSNGTVMPIVDPERSVGRRDRTITDVPEQEMPSFGVANYDTDPHPVSQQSVRVEVYNNAGGQARVEEHYRGEERVVQVIIDKVKRDITTDVRDGKGQLTAALRQTYGLRRTGATGR